MLSPVIILAVICIVFGVFAFSVPLALLIIPAIGGETISYLGIWDPSLATGLILCTHFLDILIWTYTVIGLKVFDNDLHAFYYIGAYYTTVGTTSFVVPQNWQVLPIFISFTGIFSASLSAAVLYSMINTLMQNEASKRA
jgi:hypothetical protein